MRVVDPDGVEWEVSRQWLHVPRWRVERPPLEDIGGGSWGEEIDVAGIAVSAVLVLLVIVLFVLGLPLLLLLAGLVVAVGGLVVRIAFGRPWVVLATSGTRRLEWRVRSTLGSRGAIHDVAAAIRRGDQDVSPRGAVSQP